jgi:MYXO-CTERM domain-containing protein
MKAVAGRGSLGLWVSALAWASTVTSASAFYPGSIPNGYSSPGVGRCDVCHINPAGGGARTVFGQDFERGPDGIALTSDDHLWSRWLAGRDSDGDGWSNGQELGDPMGYWFSGATPQSVYRGNPGVGSSEPSNFNLCSSSVYNDCTSSANGGSCSDVYNGIGRWVCSCQTGYTGASYRRTSSHVWTGGAGTNRYNIYSFTYGSACSDIDECTTPGRCGVGSCVNQPGTYRCNCPSGYSAPSSGGSCSDINECVVSPGICGVGSCSNSVGSYTCTCPVGYDFSGGTCTLTNACSAGTDDCDVNATCTPVGTTSWSCTCFAGYTGTGTPFRGTGDRCMDNDECASTPCGFGICTNLPGTYACTSCPSGYRAPATGGTCADIDECAETVGLCGVGTCRIPPPGYGCACEAGYSFDGTTCVDVDECADPSLSLCSINARCENSVGAFACICNTGYGGDGFNCIDVDECATGTDDCSEHAVCTNTTGAFSCACIEGYRGSGTVCADVNECASGTGGCDTNEVCINREGMVNLCNCAPGFARATDDGPCEAACGNGERTPGEACDDGNTTDGDGCSAVCDVEEGWACFEGGVGASECEQTCGDGLIDRFEECDDAAENNDSAPDACRSTCRAAGCGDGVLDTGEVCDEGDAVSDTEPDACRAATCVPAFCGDGVVDTGETCDPGGGVAREAADCVSRCGELLDAGPLDGGTEPVDDGGCGCRAVGDGSGAPWPLLLLVALGLAWRRRRS